MANSFSGEITKIHLWGLLGMKVQTGVVDETIFCFQPKARTGDRVLVTDGFLYISRNGVPLNDISRSQAAAQLENRQKV